MPFFIRNLEIVLYTLCNFLPPMLLAMVPFENKLRFSKSVTYVMIAALCVSELLLIDISFILSLSNRFIIPASLIICTVIYLIAVKAHYGKIVFTVLVLSNITNCVMIVSKWLEGMLFGRKIAMEAYRYSYSLCTLIVAAFIIVPIYIYFKNYYRNGINKNVSNTPWNYLWVIPATFYITWLHHFEDKGMRMLDIAFETEHAIFFLALNTGAFLAYHTVIRMINMTDKKLELERSNNLLSLQMLQHENLKERIAEARRTKHDIRHHIIVLNSYLQNGEYEKAKDYLNTYKRSLPDDSAIVFCAHSVINAMLLYFAQLSKNSQTDFDVVIADIPEKINLPDDVFSVVLGNLLENALDACCAYNDGERVISIRSKATNNSFYFRIENTFNGKTIRNKKGELISNKHSGSGIGLNSVRSVVKQYDGVFETEEKNGRFIVSVFLNIPPAEREEQNGDKT